MVSDMEIRIKKRYVNEFTHVEKVVLSRLGKSGAILGAASQAVFQFFQDTAHAMEPGQ